MIDKDILNKKYQALREYIRSLGSLAVAFSSNFLFIPKKRS